MVAMREFHIGDILSITTGHLVSPRHMGGVYDILNFLSGDNLFTHQLPRVGREMESRLLAQHPQLAGVDANGVNADNLKAWLEEQAAVFGEKLPVQAEHQYHEIRDPIAEAEAMVGLDRTIIVVQTGDPSA